MIDASALAKVVLQEEGWENVPLTSKTATLDYAIIEVLNAIWKAIVQKRLDEKEGKERTEALKYLGKSLLLFEAGDYLERGLEIALSEKITVYDGLYIALAEELGLNFTPPMLDNLKRAKNM